MIKKPKKNAEERAIEQRLMKNANIVLSSGKKAVIALAARGLARKMRHGSLQPRLRGMRSIARSSRQSGILSRRTGTGREGGSEG